MQIHAPHAPQTGGDRFYDLSLRILMMFVSIALVASVAFLTYRWLAPPQPTERSISVAPVPPKSNLPAKAVAIPAPPAEVLMHPGQIFKCQVGGRVVFSEQPCPQGSATVTAPGNGGATDTTPTAPAPASLAAEKKKAPAAAR